MVNILRKIITEEWGKAPDGSAIYRYTIFGNKLIASFINFGATVQRMTYDGKDIIFSMPDIDKYVKFCGGCTGATVGRYAGRIAKGEFEIDGVYYHLTKNQKGNHLHGGKHGLNTKVWNGRSFETENEAGVEFSMISPDGDEGYPGNLHVTVKFSVSSDDCFKISYHAVTDKPTIINLTNHCYFALNGIRMGKFGRPESDGDNSNVEMMIDADYITEQIDSIPTGNLISVKGTPFDFRKAKIISRDISQINGMNCYDHNFAINPHEFDKPVAIAYCRNTGIMMECFTNQPGIQLFTLGNPGIAFALETQHYPDSPNHPNFPSTILRPNEEFFSQTVYKFSVK